MKPVLLYLLQVIICSGLLYSYYHFFLRNKRFHQYNRYYLLTAALISILIPFLNIPVYFSGQAEKAVWINTLSGISSPDYILFISSKNSSHPLFTLTNLLLVLYCIAAGFILIRFIISLLHIKKIIHKYEVEKIENINFVNTEEKGTPFSFLNWMFWNRQIKLQSEEGQQIFRHELFHIRQKHTCDVIFFEALTIVFWINPFFHLIKKELTAIHEFLADKFAVRENDKWNYAELLLMHLLGTPTLRLTNPFFHNQIKRRIAMITSSQQPRYQYLKKLLVLPMLALVTILFAFSYKQKQEAGNEPVQQYRSGFLLQNPLITPDTSKPLTGTYTIKGDKIVLYTTVTDNKRQPVADLYILDSKQYSAKEFKTKYDKEFTFDGELYITEPDNADAIKRYGQQAKNGVIEFRKSAIKKSGDPDAKPLIVIDNKIMGQNKTEILKQVDPNTIQSVNILKDKSALDKYGEKGRDGVIEILTKPAPDITVEGKLLKKEINLTQLADDKNSLNEVVVDGYAKPQPDITFDKIEMPASFPGGQETWRQYLMRNLKASIPVDNGAPAGKYTVFIQFIVDKEGNISDLKPLTKHGYGMEEEVIRILTAGPKWIPARQNGQVVKAYTKQPVTFVITEEEDSKAITDFKREKLFSASELDKLSPVYPNPANNNITIPYSTQAEGSGEIIVKDISGKVYLTQKTSLIKGLNNLSINIASLSQGAYIIIVTEGKQQLAKAYKLIKQ